jgi:predicted dehydrogenase
MEKLSIALVGCGGMAGAHVEGYKDLFGRGLRVFDIRATCDVSEGNAKDKAQAIEFFQNSKPKVYTKLEKMLKNEDLDAVDICLPHNIHHSVTIECLNKGIHVLIEKPMAVTMRAAKLMIEKAGKSGKTLAVAENYRWEPKQRAFRWAIQKGLIGEPRIILWTATSWGPEPWGWREDKLSAGGSWVFDGGVHWADLERYQLGREAVEVCAATHTFDPVREGVKVTVDDMTMAIIKYERNVYSQWLWTRATPAKGMWSHVIYGSKGALSDEGLQIQKEDKIESQSVNALTNNMKNDLPTEEIERLFPKGSTNTVATEIYDFYTSIINNRKPEVDAYEGYKDMAIPLGFYESALLGRTVKIKDIEDLRLEEYQQEINVKLEL